MSEFKGCGKETWFNANKEYLKCGYIIGFGENGDYDYLLCQDCQEKKNQINSQHSSTSDEVDRGNQKRPRRKVDESSSDTSEQEKTEIMPPLNPPVSDFEKALEENANELCNNCNADISEQIEKAIQLKDKEHKQALKNFKEKLLNKWKCKGGYYEFKRIYSETELEVFGRGLVE